MCHFPRIPLNLSLLTCICLLPQHMHHIPSIPLNLSLFTCNCHLPQDILPYPLTPKYSLYTTHHPHTSSPLPTRVCYLPHPLKIIPHLLHLVHPKPHSLQPVPMKPHNPLLGWNQLNLLKILTPWLQEPKTTSPSQRTAPMILPNTPLPMLFWLQEISRRSNLRATPKLA